MAKYIFLLFIMAVSCPVCSQNRIIKGKLIYYSLEPLIGVDVLYNDSIKIGVTNVDGYNFQSR